MKIRFFLLLFIWVSISYSQTKWDFPVKLGSTKWKSLKSAQEIWKVQQIPTEILNKMSTEDVFYAWLELPGRLEVLAYNTMQKGFDVTVNRFNVLSELLKREDVGKVVFEYYQHFEPINLKLKKTSEEKGKFITDIGFVEFLLSQASVIRSLPISQVNSLLKKIAKDFDTKIGFIGKEKDPFWVETVLVLAGRLLNMRNSEHLKVRMAKNELLVKSLNDGEIYSKDVYHDLVSCVLETAKSK